VSRLDPKPGRWLLPLVVAGIIGFTAVFVNALPAADEETAADDEPSTTTTEAPPDDATTTTEGPPDQTTTSTLPPAVAEFLVAADTVSTAAADLATEARDINETWEDGRNFTLALNSLRDIATRTSDFADSVAGTTVPEGLESSWDPVLTAAGNMVTAANEMVTGLQSSDTGQIRRAALADYEAAAEELTTAVTAATAGIS
jgi:hypothetical protein